MCAGTLHYPPPCTRATPQLPCEALHDLPAVLTGVPHGLPACMQEFFREDMGLPLTMTPDYNDFSCQVRAKESWGCKKELMVCWRGLLLPM